MSFKVKNMAYWKAKNGLSSNSSPMKQGIVTCPECGLQIEDTDGSGSAMTAHMSSAHGSTGGTGAGGGTGVRNVGGLFNQGGYANDPGGWDGGAGNWDPSHTGYTGGTNFPGGGGNAAPRKMPGQVAAAAANPRKRKGFFKGLLGGIGKLF